MFSSTGSGEEDELDTGIDSFVIIDSVEAPPLPTSTDDNLREISTTPTPAHSSVVPSGEPKQGEDRSSPPQAPMEEEEEEVQSSKQLQESLNEQQQHGPDGVASPDTIGGETPPTPRANEPSAAQNETAADSGSIEFGEESDKDKAMDDGDGSQEPKNSQETKYGEEERIERASGIGAEGAEKQQEAVSPPATGSLGQQAGLVGINEVG